MAQNDFLAFATGGQANVDSQSSWAQDPTVSNGFFGGIAPSAKFNKAWRNAGFPGVGVSEWINQQLLTVPIRDNGIVQEYVDNFDAALRKLIAGMTRTRVTAPLNLYVNPSGNDNNDGLTPQTAFQTPQHAWDVVTARYDLGGQGIYINLANGNYGPFSCNYAPVGGGSVMFVGNEAQPGNVVITANNGTAINIALGAAVSLAGLTVQATGISGDYNGSGTGIISNTGGYCYFRNLNFGYCQSAHMLAIGDGVITTGGSLYSISGGSGTHAISAFGGGISLADSIVSIYNNPNFSSAFIVAESCSNQNDWNMVFYGTATGTRAIVQSNGILAIGGANPNSYLPGDGPAVTGSGGWIL